MKGRRKASQPGQRLRDGVEVHQRCPSASPRRPTASRTLSVVRRMTSPARDGITGSRVPVERGGRAKGGPHALAGAAGVGVPGGAGGVANCVPRSPAPVSPERRPEHAERSVEDVPLPVLVSPELRPAAGRAVAPGGVPRVPRRCHERRCPLGVPAVSRDAARTGSSGVTGTGVPRQASAVSPGGVLHGVTSVRLMAPRTDLSQGGVARGWAQATDPIWV